MPLILPLTADQRQNDFTSPLHHCALHAEDDNWGIKSHLEMAVCKSLMSPDVCCSCWRLVHVGCHRSRSLAHKIKSGKKVVFHWLTFGLFFNQSPWLTGVSYLIRLICCELLLFIFTMRHVPRASLCGCDTSQQTKLDAEPETQHLTKIKTVQTQSCMIIEKMLGSWKKTMGWERGLTWQLSEVPVHTEWELTIRGLKWQ